MIDRDEDISDFQANLVVQGPPTQSTTGALASGQDETDHYALRSTTGALALRQNETAQYA